MNDFDFINPTRIVFGRDKEKEVGSLFASYGLKNILIVYGSDRIEKNGLLKKATDSLDEAGVNTPYSPASVLTRPSKRPGKG